MTLNRDQCGGGHKLPTGDPDRHFTVEFSIVDRNQQMVESQTDTMGRWIMWQPAIIELYDNRLMPLASRDYTFIYRLPKDIDGYGFKRKSVTTSSRSGSTRCSSKSLD